MELYECLFPNILNYRFEYVHIIYIYIVYTFIREWRNLKKFNFWFSFSGFIFQVLFLSFSFSLWKLQFCNPFSLTLSLLLNLFFLLGFYLYSYPLSNIPYLYLILHHSDGTLTPLLSHRIDSDTSAISVLQLTILFMRLHNQLFFLLRVFCYTNLDLYHWMVSHTLGKKLPQLYSSPNPSHNLQHNLIRGVG